jgi:citrate lyase beta subunit
MSFCYDKLLPYRVGGLLYFPATKADMATKLENHAIDALTSAAFCLEDAIQESALALAEQTLKSTLAAIRAKHIADLPLLFVRICSPEHMMHVHEWLGQDEQVLTGYILPKFDPRNAQRYVQCLTQINEGRSVPLYVMPILESEQIADIATRTQTLNAIKAILDCIMPWVLNIRVGGNDLCNLFGIRRSITQNIYEIGVVRDILVDILNVFSREYVVSGVVWEYFDDHRSDRWLKGLQRELELDALNGFVGKTAIHPSQLPPIRASLCVSRTDYEDAKRLLEWQDASLGVAKSADGARMNEKKCHENWARRILCLAEVYGVKETDE